MTLKKWVHDPLILGNDQPCFTGQKETPGHSRGFLGIGFEAAKPQDWRLCLCDLPMPRPPQGGSEASEASVRRHEPGICSGGEHPSHPDSFFADTPWNLREPRSYGYPQFT